jgi:hypothetical protein
MNFRLKTFHWPFIEKAGDCSSVQQHCLAYTLLRFYPKLQFGGGLSVCDVFFYHSFILFTVIMTCIYIITHIHTHSLTHSLSVSLSLSHTHTYRRPFHGADNIATFMCRLYRNHGSFKLLDNQVSVQTCIGIALPTVTLLPGRQTHINIFL